MKNLGKALYTLNKEAKKIRDERNELIEVTFAECAKVTMMDEIYDDYKVLSEFASIVTEYAEYLSVADIDTLREEMDNMEVEGDMILVSGSEFAEEMDNAIETHVDAVIEANHKRIKTLKDSMTELYTLKSEIIRNHGVYVATHDFSDDTRELYFDLYAIDGFTFHQPVKINEAKGTPTTSIAGEISSESTVDMTIAQALEILKNA